MPPISMTLDVSKVSGWLNDAALCRVERRAYDAGRGAGRGREGVGLRRRKRQHMHGGRSNRRLRASAEHT
eukprot:scaffold9927_cov59-Phaeocystis_antarctica.AAC.5